jgi:hypothetical protein
LTAQAAEVDQVKDFNNAISMDRAAMVTRRATPSGKAIAAFVALLMLTFALGITGCSKHQTEIQKSENNPSASSQNTVSQIPAVPTPSVSTPDTKAEAELARQKAIRGRVRKMPATLTYSDVDSGLSFVYPRKSVLETGEKADSDSLVEKRIPMNFVQPGGTTLVVLELPGNSTQQTSSLFTISVNKQLSAEQCAQFVPEGEPQKDSLNNSELQKQPVVLPVLKQTVHGVEYSEFDKQTDQGTVKYYHRFVSGSTENESQAGENACYEFGLTGSKNVFPKLENILASVQIESKVDQRVVETAKTDSKPDAEAH